MRQAILLLAAFGVAGCASIGPGTMARVGPEQLRKILPGSEGIRLLALGGRPGAFEAGTWTEIGADPPGSAE